MKMFEKLKDFTFVAYIISFFIIFNFLILIAILTFTFNEEMLNLFFTQINIDQINTLFFALTMIYLGIIGADKLLTPYEEFIKIIKVDSFNNEEYVTHFSRKKFIFWLWFVYCLLYLILFYFISLNKINFKFNITNIITYFLLVSAMFISVQTLSPHLRKINILKDPAETEKNNQEEKNKEEKIWKKMKLLDFFLINLIC